MNLEVFIHALILLFFIEGLTLLFIPDKLWRHLREQISEIKTGQLRAIGIFLCICGLLSLWLI